MGLLSGLMSCGACGGSMIIVKFGAYGCAAHRDKGTCSNGRTIRATEAESRVLAALKGCLLTPENVAIYVEEYQRERRRMQQDAAKRRRAGEKRLGDLTAKIGRLLEAICDGTDTPESRALMMRLSEEKAGAEAVLSAGRPAAVERLLPNLAQQYRDTIERLQAELAATPADGADSVAGDFAAIHSLIDMVVLTPGATRYKPCGLALHGSLATLINETTPAASYEDPRGLILMVAGEGLEPPTRGL